MRSAAPQPFSQSSGPCQAGLDPFLNHRSFEFGEYRAHLKHRLPGGRRGVNPLCVQVQINVFRVDLVQETRQMLQGAAQPIDRPSHDHVELAADGSLAQPIELGALVPAI